MAKPVEHVRSSDLTFWGIAALVAWAVAVFAANVSAFVPDSVMGGLHASRLDGASLTQLRMQVADLQTETARLKQENAVLLQRFMLGEQGNNEIVRRIGALEATVPQLVEAINAGVSAIDPVTTAATGEKATSFDTEGGSVSYTNTPMSSLPAQGAARQAQPMPSVLTSVTPDSSAFGIALGPPIDAEQGESAWQTMNSKVGTLLVGLGPLLGNVEGGAGKRLVAGPIAAEADARQLCGHMAKVGIACASVPFVGKPLPF